MSCSPPPAPRLPACAPSPRKSCPPSTGSQWLSRRCSVFICLFEARGHPTDQILIVERAQNEISVLRCRLECRDQLAKLTFRLSTYLFGRFQLDRNETQWIAGAAPADSWQIGGNHSRNFRVSAGRLVIGEKHDRLARAGHLNGAGRDRVG